MIFMAYFAENVVIFDLSNFQRGFTLLEYALLCAGIVIILGSYFYGEHKYNGLKTHWLLALILLLIVISATIGIFLTPEIQYFEAIEIVDEVETLVVKEFVTTFAGKTKSLLFVLIAAVGVYVQIIVLPRLISFKRYILFLMYIIVAVSLISAFVSYFLDFDSYVHLYQHGLSGYIHPQSFVFNRNMYGLMLLLGMLSLYVIISYLPKWYNYVFLIFLFVNIFFTFSKASFGIALVTFIVHFIYRMIATFKKSKIRNIIFLVVAGILGICGILLIPFPFFMDVQLFNEARRFILEYYVELGIGSYDGRTEIWDSVISISTGVHLWFGRGLLLFNNTLFFYSGEIAVPSKVALFSHNGFLEILGQWGIVGLIPYCLGILA
ncbi:MAG: O-antigen ligase family protein, partial [Bacilli bacterium]